MTITSDGEEGSLLPPSKRDRADLDAVVRLQGRNIQRLSPGFLGGRVPFAQPITDNSETATNSDTGDTGGDGEPGDDTTYEWQWEDRHTVSATGNQTVHLTVVPVDDSLFVRWHPDGQGGVPITNEWFIVTDNRVTIADTGVLQVGDQFSFQYQFDPAEELAESIILSPGAVFQWDGVSNSFVGSQYWSDNSDLTSATISFPEGDFDGFGVYGWLPTLGTEGAVVQGVSIHARYSATVSSGSTDLTGDIGPAIYFASPGGGVLDPGGSDTFGYDVFGLGATLIADGTIRDATYVLTPTDLALVGLSMADLQARLEGGAGPTIGMRLLAWARSVGSSPDRDITVTIYESWLEVDI